VDLEVIPVEELGGDPLHHLLRGGLIDRKYSQLGPLGCLLRVRVRSAIDDDMPVPGAATVVTRLVGSQ
jgi:hypothetical protein